MNNTFLTPEVVAKEALMVLTSNLVMADLVHRDYADDFVAVGDTVSIIDGPLENFSGLVDALDQENNMVRVTISMFGRETSVELELDQVELMD